MLKPIPIHRTLVKTKAYELSFFTYAPSALEGNGKYIIASHPMLFLQQIVASYSAFTKDQLASKRFRITPRNQWRVVNFLNDVVSWFYDKDRSDLFVVGEDNNVMFNGDYNSLCAITPKAYFENDILKAFPAVVTDGGGRPVEGIRLYINRQENMIELPLIELEQLLDVLAHFSFYEESLLSMQAIQYTGIVNNGAIPTIDSVPGISTHQNGFAKSGFLK